jgi:hypothetical protein
MPLPLDLPLRCKFRNEAGHVPAFFVGRCFAPETPMIPWFARTARRTDGSTEEAPEIHLRPD